MTEKHDSDGNEPRSVASRRELPQLDLNDTVLGDDPEQVEADVDRGFEHLIQSPATKRGVGSTRFPPPGEAVPPEATPRHELSSILPPPDDPDASDEDLDEAAAIVDADDAASAKPTLLKLPSFSSQPPPPVENAAADTEGATTEDAAATEATLLDGETTVRLESVPPSGEVANRPAPTPSLDDILPADMPQHGYKGGYPPSVSPSASAPITTPSKRRGASFSTWPSIFIAALLTGALLAGVGFVFLKKRMAADRPTSESAAMVGTEPDGRAVASAAPVMDAKAGAEVDAEAPSVATATADESAPEPVAAAALQDVVVQVRPGERVAILLPDADVYLDQWNCPPSVSSKDGSPPSVVLDEPKAKTQYWVLAPECVRTPKERIKE